MLVLRFSPTWSVMLFTRESVCTKTGIFYVLHITKELCFKMPYYKYYTFHSFTYFVLIVFKEDKLRVLGGGCIEER
jgi:hypothetical protein